MGRNNLDTKWIELTGRLLGPHEGGDSFLIALHLSAALGVDLLLLEGEGRTLAKPLISVIFRYRELIPEQLAS